MRLLRAMQFALVLLLFLVGPAVPKLPVIAEPTRTFPALNLGGRLSLAYVGMFTPDAVFRTPSKAAGSGGPSLEEMILPASSPIERQHRGDVPASMLVPTERVVEDFEPPAHAMAAARANTRLGETRNRFLTYAYGHPSVLYAPRHVVTDSQQRLIISDPAGSALHVLDPKGKRSFRIVCGENRRLREPSGVAIDAADNIYVADAERGFVVVFDHNGGFLRCIGNFRGEPQYARPTGIAIDRERRHIYLSDTPRNMIFVMNLDGNVVKRFGRARDGIGHDEFEEPTDIAINREHVFVLEARGTRVQVMDHDGQAMRSFPIPHGADPNINRENGLGSDRDGNVYVSSFHSSMVRVFRDDGQLLSVFGRPGHSAGEFVGPAGLWFDSGNRLYIADSGNGRVQLFQIKVTERDNSSEKVAEVPAGPHSASSEDKSTLMKH